MKTAEHIIETVDKLVRKYHTRDPYELCQLLGIKIHYYDLQKKLKGFFYYQSRQKNIVIDHNVNGILERILVAHELGHAVLHTKIAIVVRQINRCFSLQIKTDILMLNAA